MMNASDFMNSLTGQPNNRVKEAPEAFQKLFHQLDSDGDGTLSFPEYAFLMILITTSRSEYDFAFRVFDFDGKFCKLSHRQFCHMMNALCPEQNFFAETVLHGPLIEQLFGKHGSHRESTFVEFYAFVEGLRLAIWDADFDLRMKSSPKGTILITLALRIFLTFLLRIF